ncbi:MAG: dicarboxylate/amino acid:cation symporter [Gemmatimonadaceae bacterium]
MKLSSGPLTLVALVVGFLVGGTAVATSPAGAAPLLAVTGPVGTLWVNAIRMTVIPLVVSLLITGVASMSDLRTVGRIGLRSLALFVALLASVGLMVALIAPALYTLFAVDPASAAALRESVAATGVQVPELPTFAAWLTALVPINPIRAAVDGAILPLLVFSVASAIGVAQLPDHAREHVVNLFRAIGDAMLRVVGWVLWLSPVGVFALAVTLGGRLGYTGAGAIGFYFLTHIALLLLAVVLLYPVAVFFGRVPLRAFARAALPAQTVAMGTRSSLAALPAMLDAAEHKLHLSREVSGFALPLGVSIFRLNVAVSWIVGGLFIGQLFGLPFGVQAIATFYLASIVMSFSVPGIPSGSLFIIAPLLPTVGLPVEGVGILIALDAVPDIFKSMLNVTGHLTAATVVDASQKRWSGNVRTQSDL